MGINIKKYATFFHDGAVREIEHRGDRIVLVMESAVLLPEWNEDHIELSKRETISGKLYILGVKRIVENESTNLNIFTINPPYENTSIYTFRTEFNKVLLEIWWVKYSPEYEEYGPFKYEIEADNVYWENIPSLSDEYWAMLEKELNDNELE